MNIRQDYLRAASENRKNASAQECLGARALDHALWGMKGNYLSLSPNIAAYQSTLQQQARTSVSTAHGVEA